MVDDFTKRKIRQAKAQRDGMIAPEPEAGTQWGETPAGSSLVQPSRSQSMAAAIAEIPLFNEIERLGARHSNKEDPEFDPLPLIGSAADEMGWDIADRLANTRSQAEYDAVKKSLERQQFSSRLVSNSLLSSTASIPLSLVNTQDILATAATAGVASYGTIVKNTAQASRGIMANTIKGMATAGTASTVGGGLTYESNVTFTQEDVLLGTAINTPLGALYGRIAGKVKVPTGKAPNTAGQINDLGGAMGATVKSIFRRYDENFFRDYTAAGIKQERRKQELRDTIASVKQGADMFDEGIENLPVSQLFEEMGDIPDAMMDEWWRKNNMDARVGNITAIEAALDEMPALGNTLYAQLMRSGNRRAQVLAATLLESGSGAVVNNKSFASLREFYTNTMWDGYISPHSSYLASFQKRRYNEALGQAANRTSFKQTTSRLTNYLKDKQAFDEEVILYSHYTRRGAEGTRSWSPEVVEYVNKHIEPMNQRVLELAQRMGVEGFDQVLHVKGFMPQRHNRAMYQRALARMGGDRRELSKLIQKALQSPHGSNIQDAVKARKIADAFVRRFVDDAPRSGINALDDDAWRIMDELFEQEGIELPKNSDLRTFVETETRNQERLKRRNTYAHSRTPLDLEVSHMGVRMIDLLDTDVENLLSNYSIQLGGQIALAENGYKSFADLQRMTRSIRDQSPDLNKVLDQLEAGVRTSRSTEIQNKAVLLGVKAGVLSFLNNMGMTQLIEAQTAMATLGVGNYLKSVGKAAADMWKGVRTPRSERLAKELNQALIPVGRQHWFNKPSLQKDITANPSMAVTSVGQKVDAATNALLTVQGHTSGFHLVRAIQEHATHESIMNLLTAALVEGGDMTRKTTRMLHTMGYDRKLLANVQQEIRKHAVKENGSWNFRIDRWNQDILRDYSLTMQRGLYQFVQKTMLGEEVPFMGTDTGSVLTQFMAFPVGALRKQLARNATIGNETLFATTMMGVLVGGTAITARNFLTGSKPEATFEDVLRNGFVYNSNFGMATQMWDLGISLTGAPDAWRVNPWSAINDDIIAPVSFSAINRLAGLPSAAFDMLDGDLTASSWNSLRALPVIGGHVATGRLMREDTEDE